MEAMDNISQPTNVGKEHLEPPKGARIRLFVCSCHGAENLTWDLASSQRIANILDITELQLRHYVEQTITNQKPVVVACFKQKDVAEQKISQIEVCGQFILPSCFWFELKSF